MLLRRHRRCSTGPAIAAGSEVSTKGCPLFHFSSRELRLGLSSGSSLRSYRFPGRWMTEPELDRLRKDVKSITLARLGALPTYGVFLPGRDAWRNRIVTCLYARDRTPIAFSTVVSYPLALDGRVHDVFQLGLVVANSRSAERTIIPLYSYPLAYILALRGFREYWIAQTSMIPNLIGFVTDTFVDVFPHYRHRRPPAPRVRDIARLLVSEHGDEFGAGPDSRFNEETFAVSRCYDGAAEPLRKSWDDVAKHRDPRCNELCRRTLDYNRGDDLLLIGRVNLAMLLRRTIGQFVRRR